MLDAMGITMRDTKRGKAVKVPAEAWKAVAVKLGPKFGLKTASELVFWDSFVVFPNTYMNLSGRIANNYVAKFCDGDWGELLVVQDDLDLALAQVKLRGLKQFTRSKHNGIRNILQASKGAPFCTLRVGVDRGYPLRVMDLVDLTALAGENERITLACAMYSSSATFSQIMTAINKKA